MDVQIFIENVTILGKELFTHLPFESECEWSIGIIPCLVLLMQLTEHGVETVRLRVVSYLVYFQETRSI